MALTLLAKMRNDEIAKAIELSVEYDPQPPFDAGAREKAPAPAVGLVRAAIAQRDHRPPARLNLWCVAARNLFGSIYWRGLQANLVGAAVAFVYLSFVAPPQPEPPHSERFLFLAVAPMYVVAAAVLGYYVGNRRFAPIERWLAEGREPSLEERALVLGLPWRTASLAGFGWLSAAVVFGVVTATHHPVAYVAGTVLGILLAGLSSAAVSFLLVERSLRPLFARVLVGGEPGAGLGTRPRLLVSWALGSGVALVAWQRASISKRSA